MVGAAPYAELLDRHVELQGMLEWLSSVLAHNEPAPDRGGLNAPALTSHTSCVVAGGDPSTMTNP